MEEVERERRSAKEGGGGCWGGPMDTRKKKGDTIKSRKKQEHKNGVKGGVLKLKGKDNADGQGGDCVLYITLTSAKGVRGEERKNRR